MQASGKKGKEGVRHTVTYYSILADEIGSCTVSLFWPRWEERDFCIWGNDSSIKEKIDAQITQAQDTKMFIKRTRKFNNVVIF